MDVLDKQLKDIGSHDLDVPKGLSDKVYSQMLLKSNEKAGDSTIALILGGVFLMNFLTTTLIAVICVYLDVFSSVISPLVWIGIAVVYGSVNVTLYGGIYIYRDKITSLIKLS